MNDWNPYEKYQKTEKSRQKERDIQTKVALWIAIIFSIYLFYNVVKDDFRMSHWNKLDATVLNIEVKRYFTTHRGGTKHKTVYTISYKIDKEPYIGTLKAYGDKPEYRVTQSIKILVNPDDPTQIDFIHTSYALTMGFVASTVTAAFCFSLLIFGDLRRRLFGKTIKAETRLGRNPNKNPSPEITSEQQGSGDPDQYK